MSLQIAIRRAAQRWKNANQITRNIRVLRINKGVFDVEPPRVTMRAHCQCNELE